MERQDTSQTSFDRLEDVKSEGTPIRRKRSKSIEDIQRHMARSYVSHVGVPKTDFTASQFSRVLSWMNACLKKLGRGSSDHSLLIFHKNNKFRKTVKRAVKSRFFDLVGGTVVLLNALALCFYTPGVWGDYKRRNIIIAYVSVIFLLYYIVELAMRVIAYGLIFHYKAYLRNVANILDLFVILFGFLYILLTLAEAYLAADIFGALMALKLIRVLVVFKRVKFILRALAMSVLPLIYVSIMTICVMVFFTFLGIELRHGCDLDSGCFANYTDPTGALRSVPVSDFPCHRGSGGPLGHHECPARSECVHWDLGPNYGFTSFDNFLIGMLTVFQLITLEGWTDVFYLYESACGVLVTWPFFIAAISLGSIIILNLWLGVLTSVFIGVSERQETETTIRKLKTKKKNEKDLENYRKWIQRAVELDLPSEAGSIGRRPSLSMATPWLTGREDYDSDDEGYLDAQLDLQKRASIAVQREERRDAEQRKMWHRLRYWVNRSRELALTVVKSRVYFFLILLLLMINLILLMSLHYPYNRTLDKAVFILNYIFSGIYILEGVLHLFALGARRFTSSLFHRWDFCLNVLNTVDLLLIPVIGQYHISAIINACRCYKLIKILKYTRYWSSMKQIIHTVSQVLAMIISLMALVLLFIFVYTIIGMRLFGGRLDVDSHEGLPNFDNMLSSLLLVFQLITTEDWQNVYYTSNRPWLRDRAVSIIIIPIYFTTAVIVGGFILLSIFLSIAVDKLTEVKSVEEEEGREVEKKDKERKDKKRHINALKETEGTELLGRTLKNAVRLYEQVPTDTNQKRDWEKQFSSSPVKRVAVQDDTTSGIFFSAEPQSPRITGRTPRLFNPLRFMVKSDDPKPRPQRVSMEERRAVYTTGEQGAQSPGTKASPGDPERVSVHSGETPKEVGGSVRGSSHSVSQRSRLSVASTPDMPSQKSTPTRCASFERTQSTPEETGLFAKALPAVPQDTVTRMDTIAEDSSQIEEAEQSSGEEESTVVATALPCPLSSAALVPMEREVTSRTKMESSLENILDPIRQSESRGETESTDTVPIATHVSRWKQRFQRMWNWFKDYIGTLQFDPKMELAEIPNHSAFFILSPDNSFRVFCYRLVRSKAFQVVTYVTIFLGSILLTLEIPVTSGLSEGSFFCLLQDVIIYVDLVIVVYFLIEMLLKVTALGVFLHRGSYFRGFFNIVDFIITVTTLIPIVAYLYNLRYHGAKRCLAYSYQEDLVPIYLAFLRVLRVFRPMRAIRISGLFYVLTGLISSIKSIGIILLFSLLVMSIFAVTGTILFRGSFFYCTDPNKSTEIECRGYYFTYPTGDLSCPKLRERQWLRHELNFDNFGESFLTLFTMLTSEGWQDVMYNAFNAKLYQDEPVGPEPYSSPASPIYFLLFMFIMTLLISSVFIGTVIVTFQEVGVKAFRESKLDRNQRNCLYFALTTKPRFRYIPKFELQQKVLDFISHPGFSVFIFASLLVNSVMLGLEGIEGIKQPIYWTNFIFTLLYSVEAALKIFALHPVNYFKKIWNFFEFLITFGAVLEFIVQNSVTSIVETDFRYTHFASTFRVLRLLRFIPQVRLIMWTIIKSLEIFPWVGLLLLVVVFLFAVMGMQVFGTIKMAPIEASVESPGIHITQYSNFANFPQALLLMIRVATGEDWPDIMSSCKKNRPCEDPDARHSCGNDFTYAFFPFFYFVASTLVLNLFVAIIIDNFDYLVRDKSILGAHQLSVFAKLWSIYDPSASGVLSPEEVIKLMKQCNPPVGWGTLCPQIVAYRNMMNMNMPIVDGKVSFNATLFGLVKTALNIDCSGCSDCLLVCNVRLKDKLRILFPTVPNRMLDEVLVEGNEVETVRRVYAVKLIQSRWRAFIYRRRRTIQLFQGSEKRTLKAGPRRLPDAGPELMERTVSDFELREIPASPSIVESRRSSALSAERTLTPASITSQTNNDGTRRRKPSDQQKPTPPLSPLVLTEADMAEQVDPFDDLHDDEHSELSYTSAFGTPTLSIHTFDSPQYTETTV